MKRFSWENIRILLILSVVAFLYAFSAKRNDTRHLKKTEVVFSDGANLFITSDVVNKLLIENNTAAHSIRKDKVDLNRLERAVDGHEMVEKSEVFMSIDGTLKAIVKQRTPIARVFDNTGSFYIDYKGDRMPLSENYTARVPVVTGELHQGNMNKVTGVLKMIYDDPYLNKNIIGVEVFESGYMRMKSRNFDYVIDFGSAAHASEKFRNYKAFLQKAVNDSTIAAYKNINLKFTRQVVCTK